MKFEIWNLNFDLYFFKFWFLFFYLWTYNPCLKYNVYEILFELVVDSWDVGFSDAFGGFLLIYDCCAEFGWFIIYACILNSDCFVQMSILKTENWPNWTKSNSVRFGSVDLQKMNRLIDILYQLIGSIQLIFHLKPNRNQSQIPLRCLPLGFARKQMLSKLDRSETTTYI